MKLKTHKSELKLNKTEKSELKTTARKHFVKNTIKDGIKKTDDPMEKEMVQGLMVAGYVTSKGARIGVKAVKQGKKTFLTVQKILQLIKNHDARHPGKKLLSGLSQTEQERFVKEILNRINKDERMKEELYVQWISHQGRSSYKKKKNPSIYQKRNTITNHKIPKERKTGILQRAKGIYGKITSKADQKIEKKIVKIAKDVKKQSVYQRKMAGLNLVKSSMLYVQGDEEEGKEIAKTVASVPMNMILSKIKIQIIAAMGMILPALLPLFCLLLPILLVIVIFSAGVTIQNQNTQSASLSPEVEKWRPMVQKYCDQYKIGEYTDLALALMMQESGGAEPDPMQAAEGSYGLYCIQTKNNNGGHSHSPGGIPKGHGECSINAGVQELRDALKAAKVENPYDIGRIMVALQGYNYGMLGWITWINQHGGVYTLALSQEYSRTRMPEGAKGTPEHAQLVMRYYTYNNVGGTTMLSGNGGVDVVYYSQADPRWGGTDFGGNTVGAAGCGPTSMAICISTLSKKVSPLTTCQWGAKHGYYIKGSGWSHSVIPALAKQYHLKCKGIGKNRLALSQALSEKKLVVAIMAKGHFTNGGHYIVLRGMTSDGKILVADCGSKARNKAWDFNIVYNEARSGADAGGPFWIISK